MLHFNNVVNGKPLVLKTETYTNANGDSFTVNLYKYYISNIKLPLIFLLRKMGWSAGARPTRRVEAVIGGFVFCVVTAVIVSGMMNVSLFISFFIGVLTATTAVTADLLATWFKRLLHVKYYSKLLPGQGGFLDRFDTYMVAGLVYYWLAITVLKDLLAPFLVAG